MPMEYSFESIKENLPLFEEKAKEIKETLLTNLIMIGEIPAPTFREQNRVRFLVNRFNEMNLLNCSTDEAGNALGLLPGKRGDRNILLVAHLDTVFPEEVDHTISVEPNYVIGPAVGDNSLGAATLATLPFLLEHLGIELDSNLILMGSSQSLGKGNSEGLRFFLNNSEMPIDSGICIEGVKLGRLSYSSIGLLRGEISYRVPEEYDWTRFGAVGAIVTINDVITKILEIPIPRRPRTTIVLGSVDGGKSFNTIATQAILRFEIRSESRDIVDRIHQQIGDITAEVSSHSGADIHFEVVSRRDPGGISFAHPLTQTARSILKEMDVPARISPSTSDLSAFVDKGIPGITIGLTNGEYLNEVQENIEIEGLYKGLAQLIALILAMDKGCCDEPK